MRGVLLAVIAVSGASAQGYPPDYPYLLRLDRYASGEHACALLQNNGTFHLEIGHGEHVKVFEGNLRAAQVAAVRHDLDTEPLASLSQTQIEEPLLRTRFDKLQIDIFRGNEWQELFFRSSDSQETFKKTLQPLIHWLDRLPKLPDRKLSEYEGKNNCLPRGGIELKRRGAAARPITPKIASDRISAPLRSFFSMPARDQNLPRTILTIHSIERKLGSAREGCLLVLENGNYRVERRMQNAGEKVRTTFLAGTVDDRTLRDLSILLDRPELAEIRHHEFPGSEPVVPMLGDMMQISITRSTGEQLVILSSRFGRPGLPDFYSGDADLHSADALMKFISAHIENGTGRNLSPVERNVCSEMP